MTPIPIDDGLTRFLMKTPDGDKEIALNLIEASQQFNAVTDDCNKQGLGNFEYLDRFAGWLTETTGVKVNSAQARALAREMDKLLVGKAEARDAAPGPS